MREKFLKSIKNRDPAARSYLEIILFYPGVHAIFFYRISHFLYKIHLRYLSLFISFMVRLIYNIEIHPNATIGKNCFIDHGAGVVIGETAILGDNITIYHGVTLGAKKMEKGKRHPTIENNVILGCCSTILGDINIGHDSIIGANTTLTHSVLPYTIYKEKD